MAKYIATAIGFDNVAIRNPGDVFEAPADFPPGEWFKPYKPGKGQQPAAQPEQSGEQQGDQAQV